MLLTNELVVHASIERVWRLLDELEAIVPCMPGATYISREGDNNRVSIKIKVGPINSHFEGTVQWVEKDESTHSAIMRGSGKDLGGKAAVNATVVARLNALSADSTRVTVETELAITGRLAQFGGGTIADIASRTMAQFTENLHRLIIVRPDVIENSASAGHTGTTKVTDKEEMQAFDLGSMVVGLALRRLAKYGAVPTAFFILGWLIGKFL